MVVRVDLHPPLAVATAATPPGEGGVASLHARVALEVRPPGCDVVRRGHLQLLKGLEPGAVWRPVDLGGRPLARVAGGAPDIPGDAAADLELWLSRQELVLFTARYVGAVSELGEDRAGFRARLLATVRPELTRLMNDAEADDRRRLAGSALRVVDGIEEAVIGDLQQHVRGAEIGILLLPDDASVREMPGAAGLRPARVLER